MRLGTNPTTSQVCVDAGNSSVAQMERLAKGGEASVQADLFPRSSLYKAYRVVEMGSGDSLPHCPSAWQLMLNQVI